jgi:hypothetical protein
VPPTSEHSELYLQLSADAASNGLIAQVWTVHKPSDIFAQQQVVEIDEEEDADGYIDVEPEPLEGQGGDDTASRTSDASRAVNADGDVDDIDNNNDDDRSSKADGVSLTGGDGDDAASRTSRDGAASAPAPPAKMAAEPPKTPTTPTAGEGFLRLALRLHYGRALLFLSLYLTLSRLRCLYAHTLLITQYLAQTSPR